MTSDELNSALSDLDDENLEVHGLDATGKSVPYIGWYWRYIDFDRPIPLARCQPDPAPFGSGTSFVGFIAKNKWGYDQWDTSEKEAKRIRELAEDLTKAPSNKKAQALFDYVQTLEK